MIKFKPLVTLCCHLAVLTFATADAGAQQSGAHVLRIASDDWCPYVCAHNGRLDDGYLVEALHLALSSTNYQVEMILMPFRRAMVETARGNVEGVVSPPEEAKLLMSQPLGYAHPCFYTRVNSRWTYTGVASLTGQTLGVIQDYNYDNGELFTYIGKNRVNRSLIDEARGDFGGVSNIRKLVAGRVEVIVEDEAVMPILLAGMETAMQVRPAGCLSYYEPLTLGMNRSDPRSAGFIDTLNAELVKLEASGRLAELQRRYKLSSPAGNEKKR